MDAEYPYVEAPRPEPDLLSPEELRRVCLALERRVEALQRARADLDHELKLVYNDLERCVSHLARRALVVDRGLPRRFKLSPEAVQADFANIANIMVRCNWVRADAAAVLGVEERTLYRRLREMRAAGWKIPRQGARKKTAVERPFIPVEGGIREAEGA